MGIVSVPYGALHVLNMTDAVIRGPQTCEVAQIMAIII